MPLRFNTLLAQAGISPKDVRLLRHQDRRASKGRSPYELWRDERPAFELYQGAHSFGNRSKLQAPYWASFVVTTAGETLLGGFYKATYLGVSVVDRPWPHTEGVDLAGSCDTYELVLDRGFDDFTGRLVIEWGDAERAWIQRADNQDKVILELRPDFREQDFPGFARFISPLSKIERLPSAWIAALSASKGVYLLTCPQTFEQYVGSASGETGFYGRWLSYSRDGHGGNVELKSRDASDYQVAVLEVAGSYATAEDIIGMETLWKQKLQSREMGLNRN